MHDIYLPSTYSYVNIVNWKKANIVMFPSHSLLIQFGLTRSDGQMSIERCDLWTFNFNSVQLEFQLYSRGTGLDQSTWLDYY